MTAATSNTMHVMTPKSRAKRAAKEWDAQYRGRLSGRKGHISAALHALGDDPDAVRVDEIIGNSSWTSCRCDHCFNHANIVQLGEDEDYESRTIHLCADCLNEALRLLMAATPNSGNDKQMTAEQAQAARDALLDAQARLVDAQANLSATPNADELVVAANDGVQKAIDLVKDILHKLG